ncbi:hypothetical protein Ndes2526B_g00046 [Nannochloris sp. 'desiccata']|nr:hypothetical protein NADE_001906 [Chlorella desiccata (nom. nud.)]
MALTAEERRAAAAARRQKVLGRGDSRMAQVTGTLAKPNDAAEVAAAKPIPHTTREMQHAIPSTKSISDISESSFGGADGTNGGAIHSTNGHLASSSTVPAAATTGPLKGTASGRKWSEYTDIKATPSIIRRKRSSKVLTVSEKLTTAVTATASLRLFAAILQGILLFSAWHLGSQSAPGSWTLSWQQRAFNKAWMQLKHSQYRGNLGPALKTFKAVTTTKLIIALKQPQWAALAATAQQHPMSILFVVNIALILPTYLFLIRSKSSSLTGISGGGNVYFSSQSVSSFFLWKMVSMVAPALQTQLSHALAVQKVLASIIDCAVVVVVTLGVCQLAELLLVEEKNV